MRLVRAADLLSRVKPARTGRVTRLKFCECIWYDCGIDTVFEGGETVSAWPHYNNPDYAVIAHRLGYGYDVLRYCQEHEVFHSLVAEFFFERPSLVLLALAQKRRPPTADAISEEIFVQTAQRWVRAHERPIVSLGRWDEFKEFALRLMP